MNARKALLVLAICAMIGYLVIRFSTATDDQGKASVDGAIRENQAIEIARRACENKLEVPKDAPVKVEIADGVFTITFLFTTTRPMPAPDFHAKVMIREATGEVIEVLGGS